MATTARQTTAWPNLSSYRVACLKIGQEVQLTQKHRLFIKGSLPGWTKKVFIMQRMVPGPVTTCRLTEWDGTPLEGQFYEEDVQPVTMSDDVLFRVEKIMQRRGTQVKV